MIFYTTAILNRELKSRAFLSTEKLPPKHNREDWQILQQPAEKTESRRSMFGLDVVKMMLEPKTPVHLRMILTWEGQRLHHTSFPLRPTLEQLMMPAVNIYMDVDNSLTIMREQSATKA